MPHKSKAQQKFVHANKLPFAKKWDAATKKQKGGFKALPKRARKSK